MSPTHGQPPSRSSSLRSALVLALVLALGPAFAPAPCTAQARLSDTHRTYLIDDLIDDGDQFFGRMAVGDFDGDGRDDLAVGSGYVYPDPPGVAVFLSRGNGFVLDTVLQPAHDDPRVLELASGDFDGDGEDELALGVARATAGFSAQAGVVEIYSRFGADNYVLEETFAEGSNLSGFASAYANCGNTLAAGDFDGDDYDDLAIGCPGKTVDGQATAGLVHVVFGSFFTGLLGGSDQTFSEATAGIPGDAGPGDQFGGSLAAGRINGNDSFDDLVIGIPGDSINDRDKMGSILVLYGDSSGLTTTGVQWLHRDTPGVEGTAEALAFFGEALAIGNLNFDSSGGGRDLVATSADGSVHVFYGNSTGLRTTDDEIFSASDVDLGGASSSSCDATVVTARLGSTWDRILLGCYYTTLPPVGAGMLVHLPGTPSGVDPSEGTFDTVDDTVAAPAMQNDKLGRDMVVGDFDGDGADDVAASLRDGQVLVYLSTLFQDGFESGDVEAWTSSLP